jgi:membrane protease YdiL (CAAX protease family)
MNIVDMPIFKIINPILALAILAIISMIHENRPVRDPFFADQKWTLTDAYKVFLPLFIILCAPPLVSQLLPNPPMDMRLVLQLITSSIWCIAIYALFCAVIKTSYGVTVSTFGLQKEKFLQSAVFPANIVMILLLGIVSGKEMVSQSSVYNYTMTDTSLGLFLLVVIVFVSPPLEELLFRGILYPPVTRRIGRWPAAVCLSCTFSVGHAIGDIRAALGLFLSSLLLFYVYGRSKSLYSPIILHIGINCIVARPEIKRLLAANIDGAVLDKYFIGSFVFFTLLVNILCYIQSSGRSDTGKASSTPLGATLTDERTGNDTSN